MLKLFPTDLFAPEGVEADIDRQTMSGGTSLSGAEDLAQTDGGGRVFAEFGSFYLDEPEVALAYRALSALSDGGVTPFIVPLCDCRHQPSSGTVTVPFSDDTPFSDETEFAQSGTSVTLAADAALRATTIQIAIETLPRELLGGEWFSIDHTVHRHRAYRIAEIVEQDETSATIKFRPPLREATEAGAAVSFEPRCVMRVDGEMRSPTSFGYPDASLRLVEHFPGVEGY